MFGGCKFAAKAPVTSDEPGHSLPIRSYCGDYGAGVARALRLSPSSPFSELVDGWLFSWGRPSSPTSRDQEYEL